jgi:UDP-N-acetyl-D-mannosaminuronic acid dehydrogenase
VRPDLESTVEGADLVVLLVGHTPMRQLDPLRLAALTPARLLVDTVYGWQDSQWQPAGFRIFHLGVGPGRS